VCFAFVSFFFSNFNIVYKYSPQLNSDGTVLAWLEGFDSLCNNPYDNFLFGYVDLVQVKITISNKRNKESKNNNK
jgi:hypothetical protein